MAVIGFSFDRYGNRVGLPTEPSAAQVAQVTTDIAAAQAIGAGDASAEIDALDTSYQAVVAAFTNTGTAGVKVLIDTGIAKNQAINALEQALVEVRRTTALS